MNTRVWQRRSVLVPLSLFLAIVAWFLATHWGDFPAFILPPPGLVAARFWQTLADGSLLRHSLYTLGEVLAGLVFGASIATLLGYILAKSEALERLLSPYIVASQAVPIVTG